MSYFTNQTSEYIGATGIYPLFEYVNTGSNNIYTYSSNFSSEIESLKQKDLSHDGSISSINSTIGTIQGEVATNTTAIAAQATQIATLEATTAGNTTAIAANTGSIVDLNLNKVNKSSFNSTGVIYMDVAGNVQLSYDNSCFSQYSVVNGNAMVLTLEDTYKNLPTNTTTAISQINNNLNNNYYTKTDTSNIFVTSNSFIPVLSNGLLDPMLKDSRNPVNETTSPSVTKTTFNSSYYYYVFTNDGNNQTSYDITFNNPSICDILIVAGGGGGDAGGGGGGQAILYQATSISKGTYNIKVGKGGLANNNGFNSSFNTYTATGGYSGPYINGGNSGNGLLGGIGLVNYLGTFTGGGAGAGGSGNNASSGSGGSGGSGVNYSSYFGISVGVNGSFAGGGGGFSRYNTGQTNSSTGSAGGGNGSGSSFGSGAIANTGGGGGGGYFGGGSGGSGVVIVRVLVETTPILISTNPLNKYATSNNLSNLEYNTNTNLNNNYYTRLQTSNIFTTSNHVNTNYYTRLQTSNIFTTSNHINTNFYNKSQIDGNFYNKSQIDAAVYTNYIYGNKLDIQTANIETFFADAFVNLSNNLTIRTPTVANNATYEGYNDYNIILGVGNPNDINLIPVSGLGSVSQLNTPSINLGGRFCGFKFMKNDNLLMNTNTNIILNAWSSIQLFASRITISCDEVTFAGNVTKKKPKYFTTGRIASFDGVSCLAYDIDLTKIAGIQNLNGFDFRHFRIKFFFGNGRVDYQWTPRIFDISMSSYNGFSVSCFENFYDNSALNRAHPSNYFLYRQNINLITFCCPTATFGTTHLIVNYVIEDLLSI